MARTRSRPNKTRRTGGKRGSARPASIPDILTIGRFLFRPEMVGTALVVLAFAALPMLLPLASVLDDARDAIVRGLGLHAFTLVLVVAFFGAVLALRRGAWLGRHRRHALGVGVLLVLVAGLLGRWYPAAQVGTVDLAVQSAGGDLGRRLTVNGLTMLAWALTLPLGFTLLWPRTTATMLRAIPRAAGRALAALWHLGLHRAIGRGLASLRRRRRESTSEYDQEFTLPGPMAPSEAPAVQAGLAEAIDPEIAAAEEPALPFEEDDPEEDEEEIATQIPMDMETAAESWRHSSDGWQLPPIDLLSKGSQASSGVLDSDHRARVIEETLASFGVNAKVTQINEGPAVTQFGIEPGWDIKTRTVIERDANGKPVIDDNGQQRTTDVEVSRTRVRVNRITALQNDLALALAAPALRIEAPVPGKQILGIEVPNITKTTVALRDMLESPAYKKAAEKGSLPIALGTGVTGESAVPDLASMPHLLIAGATGSGKSVCLNSIIISLLMNYSPEQLRFVLIDPKRVELTPFANIPHLAFSEIVVDIDKIRGALQAVINEMESRYRRFAKAGVRDLKRFNDQSGGRPLPYWVVVVDELADVMLANPFQVERQIVRLAQLARATGIHLVIATQRPSVDVVTGLIKANFPTRVAFSVASQVDSRTVIDQGGAEKLLGKGDMLYLATDSQKPKRLQGVYVSDDETDAVVAFWTSDRFEDLEPEKHDELLLEGERQVEEAEEQAEQEQQSDDPMLQKALTLARETNRISTSLLQRRLRIGYPRAARIMDDLEERGLIGPSEPGGSTRQVLAEPAPAIPGGGELPPDETAEPLT
jgi:S-DNA-T family DNA segregation ATPase FtsK/SpoIIIE